MLFAIAVYKKEGDHYEIAAKVDPSKGLFSGRQLDRFINVTLPRHIQEFKPNTLNYIQQAEEHHYVKYGDQDTFFVLIAKAPLTMKQLGYLFTNINQVYFHPNKSFDENKNRITLETIFHKAVEYSQKFISIEMVKLDIDETKKIILENAEKLLNRGEAIETLLARSQDLKNTSINFNKRATELRRSKRCCG